MFPQPNNENVKLEWMYKGAASNVDREEYLLGRSVDKQLEQLNAEERAQKSGGIQHPKNHVEHECIPPSIRDYKEQVGEQVDLAAKLQEDPLVLIRKREDESRRQFLSNPVQMKKLQKALKAQEKLKQKSKKKIRKDSDDDDEDDLDAKLAQRLMAFKGASSSADIPKKLKKTKEDKHLNTILMHKYNELKGYFSEKDIKDIYEGKLESSEESSSSSNEDTSRSNGSGSDNSDKIRKKRKPNEREDSNKVGYTRSKSSSMNERSRKKEKDGREVKKPKHRDVKENKREKSRNRSRERHSSKTHKKAEKTSKERHSEGKKGKRKKYESNSESDSSEDSDFEVDNKSRKSHSKHRVEQVKDKRPKERHSSRRRAKSSNSDDDDSDSEVDNKNRKSHNKHRAEQVKDKHPKESHSSRRRTKLSDSDDDNTEPKKKSNWGLTKADGTKIPLRKSRDISKSKVEPSKSEQPSDHRKKVKLSADEKQRKLKEMMQNAKWRDHEREKNISRYRENDLKEKDGTQKYNPDFLKNELLKSANSSSVESRIKSNVNNIQRSGRDMSKHFSRRH